MSQALTEFGSIFAIGKTGEAYLLDRDNLGGLGGALASTRVTTNIAIASPAVWSAADGVFVALQGDGAHGQRRQDALSEVSARFVFFCTAETVHNLGGLMRHGETGGGPIAQRSCDPC
jgi:hypothetical protein